MENDEEKSFELLQQILFEEQKLKIEELEKEIENLKFQLSDKEAKIETFYPVTTELLQRKISKSKEEVSQTLSPIMGDAIKQQIANSRNEIIDVLYPIIGETIMRSISEAIKNLYNAINLKIENSLKRGIFAKRVKSKITGVSTSELILNESYPFEINEVFLIHEASGILLTHVSSSSDYSTDGDLISGMLTAIRNFVSDSFKSDSGKQSLFEIQYGNSQIIMERGLYSYLAVVITGTEPPNLNEEISKLNFELHNKYHSELRAFDGNLKFLEGVDQPIKKFLKQFDFVEFKKEKISSIKKVKSNKSFVFASFIILGILSWYLIKQTFTSDIISKRIEEKLSDVKNLDEEKLHWKIENSKVQMFGILGSYELKSKIDSTLKTIPEIDEIENNIGVLTYPVSEDTLAFEIKNLLSHNEEIKNFEIKFHIINDEVTLSGIVPNENIKREFGYLIANIRGVRILINDIDVNNIRIDTN